MTIAINDALAVLPSGQPGVRLSHAELGAYLTKHYNTQACKTRESRHRLRDELYQDGGGDYMRHVISDVFENEEVASKRKKWVAHSGYNNVFKRVINELSSVYQSPAIRTVSGDTNNKTYNELLADLFFDVTMQEVNRLFNAHRVMLAAPRIRADGSLVIDHATPANFRVVFHPNDSTLVLGWLIRTEFRSARGNDRRVATWSLETSHEQMFLDEQMMPIESTYIEHGMGMSRWTPLERLPNRPGFFPGEEGQDLVAGAVTIWMNAILQNKETKSANKQTVLQGDVTQAARGQAADSEVPLEIPDGAAINTVDMSMDTDMFIKNASHALESVANNYGMAASYIKHQGIQSGDARELMRVPLRELRLQQHTMFRRFEKQLAEKIAITTQIHDHPKRFEATDWRIDFGETETPLTQKEGLEIFESERRLGLTNTIAFLMKRNPDLSAEQAKLMILLNIAVETERVKEMKELQSLQSGMSQPMDETPRERSITDSEQREATAA